MKLQCYKSMWGLSGDLDHIVKTAKEQGYEGIEGPIPETVSQRQYLSQLLKDYDLFYIAEIATTETYVPDRSISLKGHIEYLKEKLDHLTPLNPQFITCLGGCDAWSTMQSVDFFSHAIGLADDHDLIISFETHRGRSLFNPWKTLSIVNHIPSIKLTFDLSHWDVVCEGLQTTEEEIIQKLASNTHHIHGRVGYDQGPQVSDPRIGIYQQELERYATWWQWLWHAQRQQDYKVVTMTPEFGVDGYQYRSCDGNKTLVDLDEINLYMANYCRQLETFKLSKQSKYAI